MDANGQPVAPMFRHQPVCFGCGAENPVALGVTNSATADGAESRVRFGADHQGPPGLVHGGLLAVLLDEAMGSVPHAVRGIRLTTEMAIRYRRPTPIDTDLVCRAHIAVSSERQFSVVATIATVDDPDVVLVEGDATYVLRRATENARLEHAGTRHPPAFHECPPQLDAQLVCGAVEHVEHGAAQDEAVEVVLEGEADRAHHLEAVLRRKPERPSGEALGRDGGEHRVAVPALVGRDPGGPQRDQDVGQAVLDRLERADRLTELLARARVLRGDVEHRLSRAR